MARYFARIRIIHTMTVIKYNHPFGWHHRGLNWIFDFHGVVAAWIFAMASPATDSA